MSLFQDITLQSDILNRTLQMTRRLFLLLGENKKVFITFEVNLGYVYTGTLERFYLEPFRVGKDRLPVYMMSWNRSVQKIALFNWLESNFPLPHF